MNLAEYQRKYGIKRIDFADIEPSGLDEQYADDKLICPYCGSEIEYESEDTDIILRGTEWQCVECEKWFYVDADVTVNTTCTPMEDAVRYNRRYIEDAYRHIDECEKKGMEFPDRRYGFVEWETYQKWAKPLFENQERME